MLQTAPGVRRLQMKFIMNSYWSDYRNQCYIYLMHVEGSTGDGSIRRLLLEAEYIEDTTTLNITTHTVKDQLSYYNFTIDLTQKGLDNWQNVVEIIKSFIEIKKRNIPKVWIFKENADFQKLQQYSFSKCPLAITNQISENLSIQRNLEVCVQQKYLFDEYLPDLI